MRQFPCRLVRILSHVHGLLPQHPGRSGFLYIRHTSAVTYLAGATCPICITRTNAYLDPFYRVRRDRNQLAHGYLNRQVKAGKRGKCIPPRICSIWQKICGSSISPPGSIYFPISTRGKPCNMLGQEYPDVILEQERSFNDAGLTTFLGLRGQT